MYRKYKYTYLGSASLEKICTWFDLSHIVFKFVAVSLSLSHSLSHTHIHISLSNPTQLILVCLSVIITVSTVVNIAHKLCENAPEIGRAHV